jgi:REP element-mobilizing transposase RayT
MYLLSPDEQVQQNMSTDERKDIRSDLGSYIENDPYVVSYVCLLAPRFEEHLLIGDLSDQIYIWMKDICISFGWQLRFIDIKPKYLHWIMSVSITTYPTQFMKIICRESSQKIFDDFPKFTHKNLSNEFWAQWYFVSVGEAPYSQSAIQSFLKQIRMQQGL